MENLSSGGVFCNTFGAEEVTLRCSDGIELAALRWVSPSSKTMFTDGDHATKCRHRIICLHGWMDNASSFHRLAPALANLENVGVVEEIVAIDFPGHGRSSHKSADSTQILSDYGYYVMEALTEMGWRDSSNKDPKYKITIVAHSM
eukprot:CAMPEP_0113314556 /NCGR_PEP_ID=MMETSP0010_2-20120614/10566_1 /TAXON_ID=216773 ORGANISM="Corethron hystrix, Strain 308" /NCGR_SAMPLE_ID=MMETSP0010_2 /ASSEMBLY_ACC=CAM_ASM_000155 /LENGTH=145 /DNA_ID=CAMNT_0000170859 /DNA_START=280 /DNA_END=717 /DNA_ORIENTATION=- /assembly_acc=CAM_ASM_000155